MNSLTKIAKFNSIEATTEMATAAKETTEATAETEAAAATAEMNAEMNAAAMEMAVATTMLATAATTTNAHLCFAKRAIQNTKNDDKHKIVSIFSSNFDRLARFLIVN